MKIRWHLMIPVAVALLPVLIFAAVMIGKLGEKEQAATERGLLDTARALSLAVDIELGASIRALQILAASEHLQSGILKKFYEQARTTLPALGPWETVVLTDISGQQLINLRRPFGAPLPMSGIPDLVRRVVATRKPAVSNLAIGNVTGAPLIAVAVPVLRGGSVAYVLSAGADPNVMAALLTRQKLPADWLATLIDGNKVILARTRDSEKFVGKPAAPTFAAGIGDAGELTWRGTTLDGEEVLAAASRSDLSGWALGLAVPVSIVEGATRRTMLLTTGGALLLLLMGLSLAALFGRRTAAAFADLSRAAAALERGEIPRVASLPINEADHLGRALEHAAAVRRKAEEQLQLSEERLSLAIEGAGIGTWHHDVAAGTVLWSDKYREIFGITPDRPLTYESFLEAVHSGDRARVDQAVADAVRQRTDYDAEYRIVRPDGGVRWVTARGRAYYDAAGNPARMEGVVLDITARKLRQEESRKNLDRVKALHEIGTAITSTLDLGRVLEILLDKIDDSIPNAAATVRLVNRETGLLEPVTSKNIDESMWKSTFSRLPGGLSQIVLQSKKPVVIDNVSEDSRTRHSEFMRAHRLISFLGIPLIAKDGALGVLAVFTKDRHPFAAEEVEFLTTLAGQAALAIHNAQLYEEMFTANKVKEEFLSVMSHELRTPLSVVMGYAGMLREKMLGDVNPQQEEALKKILSRAADQLNMINSIIQTTRLESRVVTPEHGPINLPVWLDHVQAEIEAAHDNKEVALLWSYPSDPVSIVTDAGKLRQVLHNLIGNALKFTKQGSVTVSALLINGNGHAPGRSSPSHHSHFLEFKVADTGAGIPTDQLGLVFDKFYQIDSSETRLYGGLGLGLYIARRFTELLGGKVAVESRPGAGSTFTVTVPCTI